jgi:hypothetical protein
MTSESVHKLVEMLVDFWGLRRLHRYVEQGNAAADLQQGRGINGEGKKERNRSNKVKRIANMNPRKQTGRTNERYTRSISKTIHTNAEEPSSMNKSHKRALQEGGSTRTNIV